MLSVNQDLGSKPIVQMTDQELISLLPEEMRETARKVLSNNQTNQEDVKQQENVEVVTKTSTWCKVVGGLAVTTAIAGGAYYAYKKFFRGSEE